MNYDGAPGGVRYIQEGQPKVLVHPTVDAMEKFRQAQSHQQQGKTPSNRGAKELIYRGGTGGVGVETVPKVYLVFWGSQWSSDPSNEAGLLQRFFADVGASPWQNIVTQYCEGVASGTISCSGTGTPAGNQAGSFLGSWYDNATAAPSQPSQSQLAAEAVRAAQQLGSKAADNVNVQYVIATAHNNNASGFGSSYCAWHSSTSSSNGTLAYTNLPYITDAGASCGANFNGLGANAGITIVEGHEMAETITDPYPSSGWLDSSGEEIGDKCAWISSGPGASTNVLLNGSSYPVQSLWSNASSSCVVQ
jgi:serine protease